MEHIRDHAYTMTGTCVAFGHFAGVHAGHRAVAAKVVETACAQGLTPVIVSFDDELGTEKVLTTEREKAFLLEDSGIAVLLSIPPRAVDAAFLRDVLVGQLGARAIVVGADHEALGLLENNAGENAYAVIKCNVVEQDGLPVSDGRVVSALDAHQMEEAEKLLGHPFIVIGRVVPGKQLGRTVGQPTANIDFSQRKKLPVDGSYVTITVVDGVRRVGLTNIGKRPSVDSYDYTTIENHILDFSGDLYGKELVVEIRRFIRGVEKFNSLAEVQAQVAKDVQSIRAYIDSVG